MERIHWYRKKHTQLKTVAVISNTTWSIINFRKGIILALIKEGYKVIAMGPHDYFSPQVSDMGCKYIPLEKLDQSGTNPLNDLSLISEFRKVFKEEKVDYVLTYTIKPNVYGAFATLGLKTKSIATVNGLGYTFYKKGFFKLIIKLLYSFAFSIVHKVVFQNPDDRQFFLDERMTSKKKTDVVKGSGVDLNKFSHKKSFNPNSEELKIMMSARLVKEKGIVEYFEAAEIVKNKYPKVEFVLYGIASENPSAIPKETVEQMSEEGAVDFKGVTLNMNETLEDVDVLVLPSYYREGIPRVLLEGLSKGLPIITCNSVGCKETVEDSKNGYLIPIKSPDSLAKKIIDLIELPVEQREKMGLASRKKAETEFSEKTIIGFYLKELSSLNQA